jgi:hypothetical protein
MQTSPKFREIFNQQCADINAASPEMLLSAFQYSLAQLCCRLESCRGQ